MDDNNMFQNTGKVTKCHVRLIPFILLFTFYTFNNPYAFYKSKGLVIPTLKLHNCQLE